MSQPHDPQPGPAYGQEGAYATHPGSGPSGAPVPPAAPDRAQTTPAPTPPVGGASYPPVGGAAPQPGFVPPSGYGYPPPGPAPYLPRNDLAVWSLVLGLLGVLGCVFFTGVPAIIIGGNARKAVAAGQANNEGMATAGIVLGWVSTGLGVLVAALFALALLPLLFVGFTVPLMDGVMP